MMEPVVYVKSDFVVDKKIGDEIVLVPLSNNIANMSEIYTLNEVGAYIFENFDGHNSVSSIVAKITENFDIDYQTAKTDVESFIKMALEKKIIKPGIAHCK